MIRLDAFQPILAGVGLEVQAVAEDMCAPLSALGVSGTRYLDPSAMSGVADAMARNAARLSDMRNPRSRRIIFARIAGAAAVLLAADECERGSETVEREMAAFNRNRARL